MAEAIIFYKILTFIFGENLKRIFSLIFTVLFSFWRYNDEQITTEAEEDEMVTSFKSSKVKIIEGIK